MANTDFKVADIKLADWGRAEMTLAEKEMPGLDGTAPGVRHSPALKGRANFWLHPHDYPDRRAHRNPR